MLMKLPVSFEYKRLSELGLKVKHSPISVSVLEMYSGLHILRSHKHLQRISIRTQSASLTLNDVVNYNDARSSAKTLNLI